MPSRFDPSSSAEIDLEKPYDIYVAETPYKIVIYRRAHFRGLKMLARSGDLDFRAEFLEIGQANGDSVFVRRHSVIKFCDPDSKLIEEQPDPPR